MTDDARWRDWEGGHPGVIPCRACAYARAVAQICAGCARCRDCAPRGRWRVCGVGVKGCGPWCPTCQPAHQHDAQG